MLFSYAFAHTKFNDQIKNIFSSCQCNSVKILDLFTKVQIILHVTEWNKNIIKSHKHASSNSVIQVQPVV